ncbi:hypothetical protein [Pseudomonas chlororaphis]|uniref:hypothetical protein n=1 Tax=Pseudomonas chlororaphis TaxID=587753 RepID=UPI001F4BF7A2|nr:hypothetical protein [Pseudomonas chlororaphis]
MQAIKRLDMTTEVKRLFDGLQKETIANTKSRRAAMLDIVNTHTHNLTIGYTKTAISVSSRRMAHRPPNCTPYPDTVFYSP